MHLVLHVMCMGLQECMHFCVFSSYSCCIFEFDLMVKRVKWTWIILITLFLHHFSSFGFNKIKILQLLNHINSFSYRLVVFVVSNPIDPLCACNFLVDAHNFFFILINNGLTCDLVQLFKAINQISIKKKFKRK